ncbi:MAG: glycosyltransferase, partial [Acidobacteriota bacterium]
MTPLTISIVNWNTCEQLCTCLLSLREATRDIGARVVVVDNASEDGSARMVAREFPEVCLHASPRNLGFAGGNNVVLRE